MPSRQDTIPGMDAMHATIEPTAREPEIFASLMEDEANFQGTEPASLIEHENGSQIEIPGETLKPQLPKTSFGELEGGESQSVGLGEDNSSDEEGQPDSDIDEDDPEDDNSAIGTNHEDYKIFYQESRCLFKFRR